MSIIKYDRIKSRDFGARQIFASLKPRLGAIMGTCKSDASTQLLWHCPEQLRTVLLTRLDDIFIRNSVRDSAYHFVKP